MARIIIIEDADEETIRRILHEENTESKNKSIDERKTLIEKNYPTKKEKPTNHKGGSNGRPVWTKKEDKILKVFYKGKERIDWNELLKALPRRAKLSIMSRAWVIGATNNNRSKNSKKNSNTTTKVDEEKGIVKVDKKTHSTKAKWLQWTKEEIQTLKDEYPLKGGFINWKRMKKLLPNRTKETIYNRACTLKLTSQQRKKEPSPKREEKEIPQKKGKPEKESFNFNKPEVKKKVEEYQKFMVKRKASYGIYGHNEHDAFRMALTDWARFKKGQNIIQLEQNKPSNYSQQTTTITEQPSTPKPMVSQTYTIIENFPTFETISKDFNTLIESLTKHIIANKGAKLSYLQVKDVLDIEDGRKWHDFVAEFMTKSGIISDYFNVPNKFKHLREMEKYDIIVYEK
jgi:hypothetical protein